MKKSTARLITADDIDHYMASRLGEFTGKDPLTAEEWDYHASVDGGEYSLPTLLKDGRRGVMFMDELLHTQCDEEDIE